MDDLFLSSYIWGLIETVQNLGTYATAEMTQVSPTVQANINHIVNIGVKPVASVLISLFAVLELFKLSSRADSYGLSGAGSARLEMLGLSLLKIGFVVYFIQSIGNIMWGLYEAGTSLMVNIQAAASSGNISWATNYNSPEAVLVWVKAQNFGTLDRVLFNVGLLPVGIIIMLTGIAVMIIFYGRLIEIYVMVALAPIPLATMVNDEFSQIGKSFIKSFCAVVLQGAVIIIILSLYTVIINDSMVNEPDINKMVWNMAGYGILLVVALTGSSAMAKRVLNAM